MIVTLSHQKGGVGKSTIAWNLAHAFAGWLPVKVVDLDMQRSITAANAIRVSAGMKGLDVVHFDNDDAFVRFIESDSDTQLVIVDSGGFDSAMNRIAIAASDLLVTPVSDKPFDLMGLQEYERILRTLSQVQGDRIVSNVVLNNLNPALKRYGEVLDFIGESEYFDPMLSVLRQRVDTAHAIGAGKSVFEYRPESKAAAEMRTLADEVKELLHI